MFRSHNGSGEGGKENVSREIILTGIVQGVGFRPFVHRLAAEEQISGFVTNTSGTVRIVAEGDVFSLERFIHRLTEESPRGAVITDVQIRDIPPQGFTTFTIERSEGEDPPFFTVPADMATCDKCEEELFDPKDRRYRYPFINCTDCGPRFTIVRDVPYDRQQTSMSAFSLCRLCREEYEDPSTRRYHAEPNACPRCGPTVKLTDRNGNEIPCTDPIWKTAKILREGKIAAIKGLGGFHLAVDATNEEAVRKLRKRKLRDEKPFAVMVQNLEEAARLCRVTPESSKILTSKESPILLLESRIDSPLAESVAPGLSNTGVFLPYTPLHKLLIREAKVPLVMTSGNLSDEPIATDNEEALARLGSVADVFLLHDRDIVQRSDDSVVMELEGNVYPVRRARGHVPVPVVLEEEGTEVVGLGGELKNTFTVTKGRFAYLSQHIGDMEHPSVRDFYRNVLAFFTNFLKSNPVAVCRDLHPAYFTSSVAEEIKEALGAREVVTLQHHRAHLYALIAESGFSGKGVGVSFDGTGYGDDGAIWGGEFFYIDDLSMDRAGTFRYFPLQGGDSTIKEPWKTALSLLHETLGPSGALSAAKKIFREIPGESLEIVLDAVSKNVLCVPSSSCGRLFDAVSTLAGLTRKAGYEGQAAMILEALLPRTPRSILDTYPWKMEREDIIRVDVRPTFEKIAAEVLGGVDAGVISWKFHVTLAQVITEVSESILKERGGNTVLLSGGVFQNLHLTEMVVDKMEGKGYKVILHRKVPPNDGGISLGQAFFAARKMMGSVS